MAAAGVKVDGIRVMSSCSAASCDSLSGSCENVQILLLLVTAGCMFFFSFCVRFLQNLGLAFCAPRFLRLFFWYTCARAIKICKQNPARLMPCRSPFTHGKPRSEVRRIYTDPHRPTAAQSDWPAATHALQPKVRLPANPLSENKYARRTNLIQNV